MKFEDVLIFTFLHIATFCNLRFETEAQVGDGLFCRLSYFDFSVKEIIQMKYLV